MLQNVNKKLTTFLLVFILVSALSFDFSSVYANSDADDLSKMYENSVISRLFPELSKLPAPSWIKPGLRVYYESFSGNITESTSSYNSLSDYPLIKKRSVKNSMEFIVQNDIIVANNDIAWVKSTALSDVFLNVLQESLLKVSSGLGPFWINPKVLKEVKSNSLTNFTVKKIEFPLGTSTYEAFRIDYRENLSNSPHYTWIIDSDTGVLLYVSLRTYTGSTDQVSVLVSQYSQQNQRSVTTPYSLFKGASVGSTYHYVGTTKNVFLNGRSRQNPLVLTATIASLGTNWAEFEIRRVLSDQVQPLVTKLVMGSGLIVGGFWMPTSALSNLKQGDILDAYDPVSRVSVEVTFVGNKFGVPVVTIASSHRLFKNSWTYRLSDGLLVQWTEELVIDMINGTVQTNDLILEGLKAN